MAGPALRAAGVTDPRAWLWTDASLQTLVGGLTLDPADPQRIVDLGCGWGHLGLCLALAVPRARLEGLDLESDLVAVGREVSAVLGVGRRVRLTEAALEDGDGWSPGTVTVCQAVLVHQPRPRQLLARLVSRLPPGARFAAVETDAVAAARTVVDSVTERDPSYGEQRVEVAAAVAAGARQTLGVDRRLGRSLADGLAGVGLKRVASMTLPGALPADRPHAADGEASAWLRGQLAARGHGDDPVERSLAQAGGLSPARYEAWRRRQRLADAERLRALDAGDWRRTEGEGYTAAWGVRDG